MKCGCGADAAWLIREQDGHVTPYCSRCGLATGAFGVVAMLDFARKEVAGNQRPPDAGRKPSAFFFMLY